MVTIRLIGAKTYACEAFPRGIIHENDTTEVEDHIAEQLLSETYMDKKDNVRPVFELVEVDTQEQVVEDGEEDVVATSASVGVVKKSRTRVAQS